MEDVNTAAYRTIQDNLKSLVESAAFTKPRGDGFHVLFDHKEMNIYFKRIQSGEMGSRLRNLQTPESVAKMDELALWQTLLETLTFDGQDFEHTYGIVCSAGKNAVDSYSFPESVILAQSLLLVPVVQHVAPLCPNLKDDGKPDGCAIVTNGQPILMVGMVGDCVKGNFFKMLEDKQPQDVAILKDPARLGGRIEGFLKALGDSKFENISLQASLPGSGAFGGDGVTLASEFVAKISKAISSSEKVSMRLKEILLYGPKDWYTEPLVQCPAAVQQIVKAVGFGSPGEKNRIGELRTDSTRMIIAGFDPVSLAPHSVCHRTVSLEGQLGAATDLLHRIRHYEAPGRLVNVTVKKGQQKDPKDGKLSEAEDYKSWRFVKGERKGDPLADDGAYILMQNEERRPNGDCLAGWQLAAGRNA